MKNSSEEIKFFRETEKHFLTLSRMEHELYFVNKDISYYRKVYKKTLKSLEYYSSLIRLYELRASYLRKGLQIDNSKFMEKSDKILQKIKEL